MLDRGIEERGWTCVLIDVYGLPRRPSCCLTVSPQGRSSHATQLGPAFLLLGTLLLPSQCDATLHASLSRSSQSLGVALTCLLATKAPRLTPGCLVDSCAGVA